MIAFWATNIFSGGMLMPRSPHANDLSLAISSLLANDVIYRQTAKCTLLLRCLFTEVILLQDRNSVATFKLSDVCQKWQLRIRYHFSLALLLVHQLPSVQGFRYPRIFGDFRSSKDLHTLVIYH